MVVGWLAEKERWDILASSSVGTSGTLSSEVVDITEDDLYFRKGCELKKLQNLAWNEEVKDNSSFDVLLLS